MNVQMILIGSNKDNIRYKSNILEIKDFCDGSVKVTARLSGAITFGEIDDCITTSDLEKVLSKYDSMGNMCQ